MRCIIVEDNEIDSKILEKCIQREETLDLINKFQNPSEAIDYINENDIDLLFLDVEMKEITGLVLIERINKVPLIIIISAKSEYAAESYNFDVLDYIVKPLSYERFCKAINKAKTVKENIRNDKGDHFYIKQNSKYVKVSFESILYIEALADYVHIYLHDGSRITLLTTMKALLFHLPSNNFIRIHRSFIINSEKITAIEENDVIIGKKMIPISRNNKEVFLAKLNKI